MHLKQNTLVLPKTSCRIEPENCQYLVFYCASFPLKQHQFLQYLIRCPELVYFVGNLRYSNHSPLNCFLYFHTIVHRKFLSDLVFIFDL